MTRRVFIQFEGNEQKFQLLDLTQNIKGDIYVFLPGASVVKWLGLTKQNYGQSISLQTKTLAKDHAHLSIHAAGKLHVKKQKVSEYSPVLVGNKLADLPNKVLSVRHLFSAIFPEPNHLPVSPAGNRKSDFIINAKNQNPFSVACFAIPKGIPNISLQFSFHLDDIDTVPPDGGVINVELVHHIVMMVFFKPKEVTDWPDTPYLIYSDGYIAPFLLSQKNENLLIELREPLYNLDSNNNLTINLPTKHEDK